MAARRSSLLVGDLARGEHVDVGRQPLVQSPGDVGLRHRLDRFQVGDLRQGVVNLLALTRALPNLDLDGARLVGGDEGRADVGEVRAHRLRRQHCTAAGDRAAQRHRAVEPLADFLDQRKRALHARVATGTCGHGDQAVGTLLDRLLGKEVVDDVVQHHATPGMHRVVHVGACAQRGDDDGHLVLGAQLHVVIEPVVALVHDLVDRERRSRRIGVRLVMGGDALEQRLDLVSARAERAPELGAHGGRHLVPHEVPVDLPSHELRRDRLRENRVDHVLAVDLVRQEGTDRRVGLDQVRHLAVVFHFLVGADHGAQVAGRAVLKIQDHADVAVVIDRHAAPKVVCCCHKVKK